MALLVAGAMVKLKSILILCGVTLFTPVSASAQDEPKSEISAGYDFLRLADDSRQSLPSGWYGEIAWNVTPSLATFAQITGHYNLRPGSLHTFGGGLRFSAPYRKLAPFAEALAGVAILSSSSVAVLPPNHEGPVPLGLRDSGGGALLQAGAGVDLMRDAPIHVRVGGDFLHAGGDIGSIVRFAVGIVVPFNR